jgi:hypothetical protein
MLPPARFCSFYFFSFCLFGLINFKENCDDCVDLVVEVALGGGDLCRPRDLDVHAVTVDVSSRVRYPSDRVKQVPVETKGAER